MGNVFDPDRSTSISQTSLLKALLTQKMALNYQISFYSIQESYDNTNPPLKHEQESIHFSIMTSRKIKKIHKECQFLKHYHKNEKQASHFLSLLQKSEKKPALKYVKIPAPEEMIEEAQEDVNNLRDDHNDLLYDLSQLQMRHEENTKTIEENIHKAVNFSETVKELKDLTHYKTFLNNSIKLLQAKKKILSEYSKNSVGSLSLPQNLFILSNSRLLIEEYREKIILLQSSVEEKMKKFIADHDVVFQNMRNNSEDFMSTEGLKHKLKSLRDREERLKEEIKNLRIRQTSYTVIDDRSPRTFVENRNKTKSPKQRTEFRAHTKVNSDLDQKLQNFDVFLNSIRPRNNTLKILDFSKII